MTIAATPRTELEIPNLDGMPTKFAIYRRKKGGRSYQLIQIVFDEKLTEIQSRLLRLPGADMQILRLDRETPELDTFPNKDLELVITQHQQARALSRGVDAHAFLGDRILGPSVRIDCGRDDGMAHFIAIELRTLGYLGGVIQRSTIHLNGDFSPATFAVALRMPS